MAAAQTATPKLVLEPNVPTLIALKYPTGKMVESRFSDEQQVYYSLADGRAAYLSLSTSKKISDLKLGNREEFYICKKQTGKAQHGYVDVWLTPQGEKDRAADEAAAGGPTEKSELEGQLEASLLKQERDLAAKLEALRQERRKPATSAGAPPTQPQGTGTNGPQAIPARSPERQPVAQAWGQALLSQTNQLIDVYADACRHADTAGVSHAAVRTFLISAFIGQQKGKPYTS